MNTFGSLFRVSIFGESHGACVGVTIDGCPSGIALSLEEIQRELDRRVPGASALSTARREPDAPKILSGVLGGVTTGMPITMLIENTDVQSEQYDFIAQMPRPSHADFTAKMKYRGYADMRGGGQFSGRMTAALVMAGAIAKRVLSAEAIAVAAHTTQIGAVRLRRKIPFEDIAGNAEKNVVRCADAETAKRMEAAILAAKKEGDSIGGVVECIVNNVPVGLGEPFFDSVESTLAHLLFSIPAVKGVEFGKGFEIAKMRGSTANDSFCVCGERIMTATNNSGGILGGITNGMPVVFRAAFKPTPSISKSQQTVEYATMKEKELIIKGRHDPCIVPRAVPVVEACAALAFADLLLRQCAYSVAEKR